jgi:hypothetical protein
MAAPRGRPSIGKSPLLVFSGTEESAFLKERIKELFPVGAPIGAHGFVGAFGRRLVVNAPGHMRQHADPGLDPVADDIACYALDLLAREKEFRKSGFNPLFSTG